MKRFVLLLTVLVATLTAHADSFPYLTFETTEGAKASIPVSSLTMTIDGNTLKVGDQQFTLTNLAKMYFSTTDETAAGIENVNDNESYTEIYDLQGKRIGPSKSSLKEDFISSPFKGDGRGSKGVYIVKTKEKTYKLMVR